MAEARLSAGGRRRQRLPKRSLQQTRELMLQAATNLVAAGVSDASDGAIAAALAHIRLTDVAVEATRIVTAEISEHGDGAAGIPREAKVTTGAIYQVWPSQPDFQVDLLFHIAELNAVSGSLIDELPAIIEEVVAAGGAVDEALRAIIERSFQYTRQSALFYASLCFYTRAGNERVREVLRRSTETFLREIRSVWAQLLDCYGLELRDGYTVEDLALCVGALIEGLALEWISDPERLPDPLGRPDWSMASRGAQILLEGMTQAGSHPDLAPRPLASDGPGGED